MPHEDTNRIYEIEVSHEDFTALANGETIELMTIPNDRMEIFGWNIDVTEAFTGIGLTSATLQVGTLSGSTCNQIIEVGDCNVTGQNPAWGTIWNNVTPKHIIVDSGDKLYIRLESNILVNSLVTGEATVYLTILQH